jgi:hypothetical protein
MNLPYFFTDIRSYFAYQFTALRTRAMRDHWIAKLIGNSNTMEIFPGTERRLSPNRNMIGIKNIHVADIIGSLNRQADFDPQFRPLKKHILNRWVNAYILHEQDGWPAIIVHKVGNQYFVEDGHHRVSVARTIGMDFIEAKVWEYSFAENTKVISSCCYEAQCVPSKRQKAYATT